MATRAKFHVTAITKRPHWQKKPDGSMQTIDEITLDPVSGGSEENKRFFEASPSGKIVIGCLNQAAAAQFEVGKSYYIDFIPAEV